MADKETYPSANDNAFADIAVKLRDIEEKQNIIKDRVLLIGENLVAEKEESNIEVSQLKSTMNQISEDIKRLKLSVERVIDDSDNFIRKNEFQVLQRQFEMFQPLELARISDVEDMIRRAMKK